MEGTFRTCCFGGCCPEDFDDQGRDLEVILPLALALGF